MKFKHHLEFRWRWKFNMFKYQTKDNQPKLLKQVKWKIKDYSKWLTYCSCTGKCMQRKKHNMTIYIYIIYVKIFKFLYIDIKQARFLVFMLTLIWRYERGNANFPDYPYVVVSHRLSGYIGHTHSVDDCKSKVIEYETSRSN